MLNSCWGFALFTATRAATRRSRSAVRQYVAEILRKAAEEHRMEMNNFASMEATMCLKLHAAEAERSALEEKVRRMEDKVGQLKAAAAADRDAAAGAYVAQAAELADARYQNEQLSSVRFPPRVLGPPRARLLNEHRCSGSIRRHSYSEATVHH
jgi:phage protein D